MSRRLLMRSQAGELRVSEVANGTLVRFFARVQSRVVPKRRRLRKRLLAELALEWFLHSVDAHVRAQVASRVESPPAKSALEPSGNHCGLHSLRVEFVNCVF